MRMLKQKQNQTEINLLLNVTALVLYRTEHKIELVYRLWIGCCRRWPLLTPLPYFVLNFSDIQQIYGYWHIMKFQKERNVEAVIQGP